MHGMSKVKNKNEPAVRLCMPILVMSRPTKHF
jgi:hypothetical protein